MAKTEVVSQQFVPVYQNSGGGGGNVYGTAGESIAAGLTMAGQAFADRAAEQRRIKGLKEIETLRADLQKDVNAENSFNQTEAGQMANLGRQLSGNKGLPIEEAIKLAMPVAMDIRKKLVQQEFEMADAQEQKVFDRQTQRSIREQNASIMANLRVASEDAAIAQAYATAYQRFPDQLAEINKDLNKAVTAKTQQYLARLQAEDSAKDVGTGKALKILDMMAPENVSRPSWFNAFKPNEDRTRAMVAGLAAGEAVGSDTTSFGWQPGTPMSEAQKSAAREGLAGILADQPPEMRDTILAYFDSRYLGKAVSQVGAEGGDVKQQLLSMTTPGSIGMSRAFATGLLELKRDIERGQTYTAENNRAIEGIKTGVSEVDSKLAEAAAKFKANPDTQLAFNVIGGVLADYIRDTDEIAFIDSAEFSSNLEKMKILNDGALKANPMQQAAAMQKVLASSALRNIGYGMEYARAKGVPLPDTAEQLDEYAKSSGIATEWEKAKADGNGTWQSLLRTQLDSAVQQAQGDLAPEMRSKIAELDAEVPEVMKMLRAGIPMDQIPNNLRDTLSILQSGENYRRTLRGQAPTSADSISKMQAEDSAMTEKVSSVIGQKVGNLVSPGAKAPTPEAPMKATVSPEGPAAPVEAAPQTSARYLPAATNGARSRALALRESGYLDSQGFGEDSNAGVRKWVFDNYDPGQINERIANRSFEAVKTSRQAIQGQIQRPPQVAMGQQGPQGQGQPQQGQQGQPQGQAPRTASAQPQPTQQPMGYGPRGVQPPQAPMAPQAPRFA